MLSELLYTASGGGGYPMTLNSDPLTNNNTNYKTAQMSIVTGASGLKAKMFSDWNSGGNWGTGGTWSAGTYSIGMYINGTWDSTREYNPMSQDGVDIDLPANSTVQFAIYTRGNTYANRVRLEIS